MINNFKEEKDMSNQQCEIVESGSIDLKQEGIRVAKELAVICLDDCKEPTANYAHLLVTSFFDYLMRRITA